MSRPTATQQRVNNLILEITFDELIKPEKKHKKQGAPKG